MANRYSGSKTRCRQPLNPSLANADQAQMRGEPARGVDKWRSETLYNAPTHGQKNLLLRDGSWRDGI